MKNKELQPDEQGYYYIHRWVRPSNFMNWSDIELEDYYNIYMIHRDSNLIEQSNFICLAKMCGIKCTATEADHNEGDLNKAFIFGSTCWARGWRSNLMVHHTQKELLDKMEHEAYELTQYSIVDDCHHGDLEYNAIIEYGETFTDSMIKDLLEEVGRSADYVEDKGLWEYPDEDGNIYERVRTYIYNG